MARKPQGETPATPKDRQRASRARQRDKDSEAVADPASADDMTLARLIARAAAGISRGNPDMREIHERMLVKYCRELCDRYETAGGGDDGDHTK